MSNEYIGVWELDVDLKSELGERQVLLMKNFKAKKRV